jgi:hypothetical protein
MASRHPGESGAVVLHAGVGGIVFCGAVPFDLFTFAFIRGRFAQGMIQTASGSPRTRPFIRAHHPSRARSLTQVLGRGAGRQE